MDLNLSFMQVGQVELVEQFSCFKHHKSQVWPYFPFLYHFDSLRVCQVAYGSPSVYLEIVKELMNN